jgi:hypothetical protein
MPAEEFRRVVGGLRKELNGEEFVQNKKEF